MGDGVLAGVRGRPRLGRPTGASVSAMNDIDAHAAHRVPRGASSPTGPTCSTKVVPDLPAGRQADAARQRRVGRRAQARQRRSSSPTTIREITPTGIVTADGVEHEVDVIIYGTGFQASKFLTPMTVTGRGGVDLHEQWGGDARAYLGITVPGFPNLFCLYGPNTNIVDQRQHHLLLRVRRALHPRLPRAAARRRPPRARRAQRRARRVQRARRRREPAHGVGLVRREQLVQERAAAASPRTGRSRCSSTGSAPCAPTPTTTSSLS